MERRPELVFPPQSAQPGRSGLRAAGGATFGAIRFGSDPVGGGVHRALAAARAVVADGADLPGLVVAVCALPGEPFPGGRGRGGRKGVSFATGGGGTGERRHAKAGVECGGRVPARCGGSGAGGFRRFRPGAEAVAGAGGVEPGGVRAVVWRAGGHAPADGGADVWQRAAADGTTAAARKRCRSGAGPVDRALGQGGFTP